MLKKDEKNIIREALMEYRTMLFKNFHGTSDEKERIAKLNHLLQTWKL
ncbi:MAG: hypothetical protein HUK21_03650 [Fibrobacteraceae bacterium]|nr:hypothetical protein [Fibrobacteraceae bacterium]